MLNRFTPRTIALLIGLFALSRALLIAVGLAAPSIQPINTGDQFTHLRDGGAALDMWYRWDAGFYTTIATEGYDWLNARRPSDDMAFMPVYPLLVRAVSGLTPEGCALSPYWSTCTTIGGLIISNGALLGSLFLLFWLADVRHGRAVAWRTALLLLASPIGVFLSGVYTESLFLLFSLGAAACLERGRAGWALLLVLIAALTRSVGMALAALLLWGWALEARGAARWGSAAVALLPMAVFAAYILSMGVIAGEPLAYFRTYELTWNRTAGTPIDAFAVYFSGVPVSWFGWDVSWLDLIVTVAALGLALTLIIRERGLRRGEGVYALGALLLPIASGTLIGMPRFAAVLYPFYPALARWADRPWRVMLVYGASAALALLFTVRFVTWRWVA